MGIIIQLVLITIVAIIKILFYFTVFAFCCIQLSTSIV